MIRPVKIATAGMPKMKERSNAGLRNHAQWVLATSLVITDISSSPPRCSTESYAGRFNNLLHKKAQNLAVQAAGLLDKLFVEGFTVEEMLMESAAAPASETRKGRAIRC